MSAQTAKWDGRTDGLPWMHRSLVWMLRYIPIGVFYAIMDVVILFYILFARSYSRAIYHYFHRIHSKGRFSSAAHTYRLFRQFGQVVIDRFAVYAGRHFELEIDGNELVMEAMKKPESCIMLSSHVGNYEMAGYALHPTKPMYAIMYGGEKAYVMEQRKREFERNGIHIIIPDEGFDYIYTLHNILESGSMLTLSADRNFGSPKTVRAEVLGREANLPRGPFSIAAMYEQTVLCVFVMKEKRRKYHIYVRELKGSDAASYARAFAKELTDVVSMYPDQWYNFYEFWQ